MSTVLVDDGLYGSCGVTVSRFAWVFGVEFLTTRCATWGLLILALWRSPDLRSSSRSGGAEGVSMGTFWLVWLGGMLLLAIFAAALGGALKKNPWAIFIDSRNTWSLSQFQLVVWTFVGLPLIVATAIWRARYDSGAAWDFTIPGELLALMGISLGSTVTSLAIKGTKDANRSAFVAARAAAVDHPPFADMFAVEEGSSGLKNLDVTKIQNFVLTVFLLASYVWIVIVAFADMTSDAAPSALPAMSDSMVGLLALSHGGYLVGKIPNRSGDPKDDQRQIVSVATMG